MRKSIKFIGRLLRFRSKSCNLVHLPPGKLQNFPDDEVHLHNQKNLTRVSLLFVASHADTSQLDAKLLTFFDTPLLLLQCPNV